MGVQLGCLTMATTTMLASVMRSIASGRPGLGMRPRSVMRCGCGSRLMTATRIAIAIGTTTGIGIVTTGNH